ncbi:MAG: AAA family ATPase, partial [Planctomycetota bacterium]
FVSSTFSDLKHERNALQREVFPKLEQLCLQQGFQFQAIDLRWGVPTEAGLDHRTMRICFEELRRSQEVSPEPNFLILLGDRYGWRPLLEEISTDEFQALKAASHQLDGGTTDGPMVSLLRQWYLCDANAVPPVHVLRSRQQKIPGDSHDYTDDVVWRPVQDALWEIINATWPATELTTRFRNLPPPGQATTGESNSPRTLPPIVRFQASATEQEIWCGALNVPNANEHVVAVIRKIDNLERASRDPRSRDFVDLDGTNQLDRDSSNAQMQLQTLLRDRLNDVHVAEGVTLHEVPDANGQKKLDVTTNHLEAMSTWVLARLTPIIQKQIDDYKKPKTTPGSANATKDAEQFSRDLEIEREAHQRFADERAPVYVDERGEVDGVVGREKATLDILDYLLRDDSRLLVVHGASGCGKTALLAHATRKAAKQQSSRIAIARFLGTTSKSSDLRSLLVNLCCELRQSFPLERELPADVRELVQEFYDQLDRATANRPIQVFLDALDQLEDTEGARQLTWLRSTPLPPYAKLVVSCLSDQQDDELATEPYNVLKRRGLLANYVSLESLSFEEARTLLFDTWLRRAGRTVSATQPSQRSQQQLILDRIQPAEAAECRSPLYLKILFEEVRHWRSYDAPTELGGSVSELLEQLFVRLSLETNHGPMLVERALGYIAAARRGLSETEILEVLFADREFRRSILRTSIANKHQMPRRPKRIPIAIWSRLRSDLAPYLSERSAPGGNVLTLYHRQFAEWI